MKTALVVVLSVMFGYLCAPQLVDAGSRFVYWKVPPGVRHVNITSLYNGKKEFSYNLSVRPGQVFKVRAK